MKYFFIMSQNRHVPPTDVLDDAQRPHRNQPWLHIEDTDATAGLPNRSRLRSSASTNYELPAYHHKIGERDASWKNLPK